jgi:hypothetical protein
MTLLDQTIIRDFCDYSFGDQSGEGCVHNWHMKPANINNHEFINAYNLAKANGKKFMTLFIDNIRLYKRNNVKYTAMENELPHVKLIKDNRVKQLFQNNDLLELCSILSDMNFVIFSGFEDTPLDDEIHNKIPDNVLGIHASNALSFGGKVHPMPYGLQRKLNHTDIRHEIIESMLAVDVEPNNLLYINHSLSSNFAERNGVNNLFKDKSFAYIENTKLDYQQYFLQIKNHKFMICASGNAIGCDCHRDWEVLYMKRVPIVIDSNYLRNVFDGLPVLFVKDWNDITEELLLNNNDLFERAKNIDSELLDQNQRLSKIMDLYK